MVGPACAPGDGEQARSDPLSHSAFPSQAREITNGVAPEPFRWTAEALLALQEVRRKTEMERMERKTLSTPHDPHSRLSSLFLGHGGLHRPPVRGHQPVRDPREAGDDQ